MKKNIYFPLLISLSIVFFGCTSLSKSTNSDKNDWKLSIQSYTFHRYSVVESIEKANQLGVKYLEVFPHQKLGGDLGSDIFNYLLNNKKRDGILEIANKHNVKLVSTGVMRAKGFEEWEKIFSFADYMGMEYINAEPEHQDWDVVEKLAKKYNIKIATHNHPSETSYWNPEKLLNLIGKRSKLLGACVDIGHYKRMGVEPLPSIKKLKGRVHSVHFKDIRAKDEKTYEDVIWGNGVLPLKEILRELKKQKFNGYITIEYEGNWNDNMEDIQKSTDYFNKIASEL